MISNLLNNNKALFNNEENFSYIFNSSDLDCISNQKLSNIRNSRPGVFLGKGVLKICRKFTGEHPCRSAIPINLQRQIIEITLRHGYSSVSLLHIFRTPFPKNTFKRLLLNIDNSNFENSKLLSNQR